MTAFLKKHRVWLSAILLITIMPFSLIIKAESDAEKKLGLPAGTAGHQQDEELEFLRKPTGRKEHRQPDDSIGVQSHPLSEPNRQDKKKTYKQGATE